MYACLCLRSITMARRISNAAARFAWLGHFAVAHHHLVDELPAGDGEGSPQPSPTPLQTTTPCTTPFLYLFSLTTASPAFADTLGVACDLCNATTDLVAGQTTTATSMSHHLLARLDLQLQVHPRPASVPAAPAQPSVTPGRLRSVVVSSLALSSFLATMRCCLRRQKIP